MGKKGTKNNASAALKTSASLLEKIEQLIEEDQPMPPISVAQTRNDIVVLANALFETLEEVKRLEALCKDLACGEIEVDGRKWQYRSLYDGWVLKDNEYATWVISNSGRKCWRHAVVNRPSVGPFPSIFDAIYDLTKGWKKS